MAVVIWRSLGARVVMLVMFGGSHPQLCLPGATGRPAQHGRRQAPANGEQGDQQDDEPEAELLHGGEVIRGLGRKT